MKVTADQFDEVVERSEKYRHSIDGLAAAFVGLGDDLDSVIISAEWYAKDMGLSAEETDKLISKIRELGEVAYGHSVFPEIAKWADQAATSVKGLSNATKDVGFGGGPGGFGSGTSHITMYVTIPIGNITADVDLGEVQKVIVDGLAEGLLKRGW